MESIMQALAIVQDITIKVVVICLFFSGIIIHIVMDIISYIQIKQLKKKIESSTKLTIHTEISDNVVYKKLLQASRDGRLIIDKADVK